MTHRMGHGHHSVGESSLARWNIVFSGAKNERIEGAKRCRAAVVSRKALFKSKVKFEWRANRVWSDHTAGTHGHIQKRHDKERASENDFVKHLYHRENIQWDPCGARCATFCFGTRRMKLCNLSPLCDGRMYMDEHARAFHKFTSYHCIRAERHGRESTGSAKGREIAISLYYCTH